MQRRKIILAGIAAIMGLMFVQSARADYEPLSYNDHGRRDPFQPLVSTSGAIINIAGDLLISDMELQGIMLDPSGSSLAIINGMIVKLNGMLGSYYVTKIEKNSVTLQKGNEIFVLNLKKEE